MITTSDLLFEFKYKSVLHNQSSFIKQEIKLSIVITVMAGSMYLSCGQAEQEKEKPEPNSSTTIPVAPQQQTKADKNLLIGSWERTDASYQLNISEMMADGTIKAEYLNPKSINVAKAMWAQTGDALTVYVELRDVNYPGSYYQLTYLPGADKLAGKYFQAVESATYDIEFVRKK